MNVELCSKCDTRWMWMGSTDDRNARAVAMTNDTAEVVAVVVAFVQQYAGDLE